MIHRSTEKTICFFYAPVGRAIFPRTPHAWEIIRRLWLQVHGNLTPAGYSASSVEKYHYPRICYRLRRLPSGLSLHGLVPLILYRSHRVPAGLAWGVIFLPMPGMYLMNVCLFVKHHGFLALHCTIGELFSENKKIFSSFQKTICGVYPGA